MDRRFKPLQLLGAFLVMAGVCTTVLPPGLIMCLLPGSRAAAAPAELTSLVGGHLQLQYVALAVICFALPALASVIKVGARLVIVQGAQCSM